MMQKNQSIGNNFDPTSVLDPFSYTHIASGSDMKTWSLDRRSLYQKSKEATPEKIPKELASIIEQTLIPVYMDGTSRPPRKCRIISS